MLRFKMTDNMDIELPPESTSSIEPRDRLLLVFSISLLNRLYIYMYVY